MYKTSKYNHFFPNTEFGTILFNAKTSALAIIDNLKYIEICNILNHKAVPDKEILDYLLNLGFLITSDTDELAEINNYLYATRYNTKSLTMVIAPTFNCNFSCNYCFEKNTNTKIMSKEIQKQIIEFVSQKINRISNLNIIWFGGEPLLSLAVIKNLSPSFLSLCKKNNVEYKAQIYSNGYLLNKTNVKILRDSKVLTIRIPFDGNKEIHDKRRFLKNNKPTFDKIFNNLKDYYDNFQEIILKINIDHENYGDIQNLINIIKPIDIKQKITINFGYVRKIGAYTNYLSYEKYWKIIGKIINNNSKENIRFIDFPSPKGSFCSADSDFSYIIDPEGFIYKCFSDIGDKNLAIGNILNGEKEVINGIGTKNQPYCHQYMSYNPISSKKCRNCNILPICMGGCPEKYINHQHTCWLFKKCLKDILITYIRANQK